MLPNHRRIGAAGVVGGQLHPTAKRERILNGGFGVGNAEEDFAFLIGVEHVADVRRIFVEAIGEAGQL